MLLITEEASQPIAGSKAMPTGMHPLRPAQLTRFDPRSCTG
jgi:hypothetical protein